MADISLPANFDKAPVTLGDLKASLDRIEAKLGTAPPKENDSDSESTDSEQPHKHTIEQAISSVISPPPPPPPPSISSSSQSSQRRKASNDD